MSTTDAGMESVAEPQQEHTAEDAARLQTSFNVLAQVENQLRFADSKAGFIATLHAFLIGPLAGNASGVRQVVGSFDDGAKILLAFCTLTYCVLFLVTLSIVAMTVLPRTKRRRRPASKAFFGRIAHEYGDDPERFIAELGDMNDKHWLSEIGQYILDVSTIATVKHRLVRLATIMTIPTVGFWLLMVVVLFCAGRF